MSGYSEMINELREFVSATKEFKQALKSGELSKNAAVNAAKIVGKDVEAICETAVSRFYDAYNPIFYKRTESLYKAYKINVNGASINIQADGSLLPDTHRANPEYIYQLSFEMGWHGGAIDGKKHPNPGIPWYRTPPPHFAKKGDSYEVPWSRWSKYSAKNSLPPELQINAGLDEYENGIIGKYNRSANTLDNAMNDAWDEQFNKYKISKIV